MTCQLTCDDPVHKLNNSHSNLSNKITVLSGTQQQAAFPTLQFNKEFQTQNCLEVPLGQMSGEAEAAANKPEENRRPLPPAGILNVAMGNSISANNVPANVPPSNFILMHTIRIPPMG